ncbi:FAD-dependent oxidoreductase [Magnetospirillum sp. 15-1]|uniref:NAD(P)/FAD-dependent oxidoreductase n=1 Tax=Magnetospirillum sp. 15-1 TaxID=1979370 RepID=UPI000BBC98F1|nr:FAD-dependent oxidoreductase [Magnetospirillum sp. 15-1]
MVGLDDPIVIIGAGMAGVSAAESLRSEGYDGALVLISAESELPYDRPPLSKAYLLQGDREAIRLKPASFFAEQRIDLRTGCRVIGVDTTAAKVGLSDGSWLRFSRLMLATGASPRRLPLFEVARTPVHYLRSLADADAIRAALLPGARLALIGGGVIGLELAATARELGADVVVIELGDRLMGRSASPPLADFLLARHRAEGVDIRLGRQVTRLPSHGTLELDDGSNVAADMIVVGAGAVPDLSLARSLGLAVGAGIVVDGRGRCSKPGFFAAGDVAEQRNPITGVSERIETWANAQNQAIAVARTMLHGDSAAEYRDPPWYWTDQYDLKVQSMGKTQASSYATRIASGGAGRVFFHLEGDRLVGGSTVNANREMAMIRRLILAGRPLSPAALEDTSCDLKTLLATR